MVQVAHLVMEELEEPLELVEVAVVMVLKLLVEVVVIVEIMKTKLMVVVEAMVEMHRVVQMVVPVVVRLVEVELVQMVLR